ncbi:hypothetical protein TWF694_008045 [Orbilia ellipsospora]|uniref:Uncharacterized protein n=2 Tax=Orbilia ellipsospora TaxID=2528407 RepID=A0AAV9XI98_9PEZI
MCRLSTCGTCNGKTWFGCGLHKETVLGPIPKEEWCSCPKSEGDPYPPMGSMPSFINLKNIMPRFW